MSDNARLDGNFGTASSPSPSGAVLRSLPNMYTTEVPQDKRKSIKMPMGSWLYRLHRETSPLLRLMGRFTLPSAIRTPKGSLALLNTESIIPMSDDPCCPVHEIDGFSESSLDMISVSRAPRTNALFVYFGSIYNISTIY